MNPFLNESSDSVIHWSIWSHLFTLLKKTIEPCPKHNRKCNGYNGNCIGFNGNYDGVYLMDSIGGMLNPIGKMPKTHHKKEF